MFNRLTLTAAAATLTLTGCAKHIAAQPALDPSKDTALISVTHVDASTVDNSTLFLTVDGQDAGEVEAGKSVDLHVEPGAHQVAGYARSLFGRVTIPGVKVTTKADDTQYVAYTLVQNKPALAETTPSLDAKPQSADKPQS